MFLKRQRIHEGMDEMYEIVHQATYRFFGIDEVYKLVMDEMNKIGRLIAKCWHCGFKENILNFALSPLCLVYIKFLMPSVLKLGCKRCIGWKE